jgi:hypothetical protein
LPDNVFCAKGQLCTTGACVDAGDWITRGEDARVTTGGYVYTFQQQGATITPLTSTGIPFPPDPNGLTGKALAVMGTIPPVVPAQSIYPIAALGWSFSDEIVSINGTARGNGIQFYARSPSALALQVLVADIWTDARFPNCSTSSDPSVVNACFNFPTASCNLPAGNTWVLCRFLWADFKRADFQNAGKGMPVDANAITSMQLNPPSTQAGGTTATFQFAIDDVSFVR